MLRQPLLGNLTTTQQPWLARIQNLGGMQLEEAQGRERPGIVSTSHSTADAEQQDGSCPLATNLDQTLVSTLLDTKFQMEPEGIVLEYPSPE